jgi:transcriptional regulator with XRE-family HTH domain
MVQRAELGAFLRARREASDPVTAGFPAGPRRRTPGLRREELAQLAGLSVTWYTWLELARDITVSRPVIDSLARALRLGAAERAHLFTLAGLALPPADPAPPVVEPTLARLVDALHPHPAYVASAWWDVLACNDAYAGLIGGLAHRPPAERNVLWITFVEARGSGHLLDWEVEARSLVGQLRAALARHPHDPRGPELLAALLAADDTFREMWAEHAVVHFETARKRLRHPTLGRLDLDYTKLIAATDERQMLIAFLPADEQSAARLETLRSADPVGQVRGVGRGPDVDLTQGSRGTAGEERGAGAQNDRGEVEA